MINSLLIFNGARRCRNWQTSKTKDLVGAISCGFKSHSPQHNETLECKAQGFFIFIIPYAAEA